MTELPHLLLVHGAWHSSGAFRLLRAELGDVACSAVDLPSSGLAPDRLGTLTDDATLVRAAVAGIDGPVVVLGHSYGGAVISEALAGAPNVTRLVYLAAFQLDVGESLFQAAGGAPLPWFDWQEERGFVDARDAREVFYADVDPDLAASATVQLRHQSTASFTQPLSQAAWRSIPSTYIACTQDRAIPYPAQQAMARRATDVLTMETSHSPFLSRPGELAGLLRHVLAG
ncbi:alpha/beta fold hydrolase [Modestobacter sp. I12A-02628]|uniref:Alpha/beta hydrolase n=1 Tax=Goekera deserti TaxID=2497753 RepID=A0A7K3WEY0_9ACTN|nr:alpha/beta hydrolase [Goekera deserti]MPQ98017.1 alpha/beta fold hydrolase [Goekera deserti]NDI48664.1 alpha/beta fold hydrolase [Goekera deserti]NEL54957.1 alpha/beta hydrolase [Goekera deserti]